MFSNDVSLRDIQQLELKMLQFLDQICEKYNLKYYLCGGTLIGAAREKGFIPWDDDVDVMMPRKDYEWLLAHRDEIFTDKYFLYDYKIDKKENNPRSLPALCDKSMRILYSHGNVSREQYILLDIFVLDGMPKGKIRRNLHYYHFLVWHALLQLSWYDTTVNQYRADRSILEKIIIKLINSIKYRPNWDSQKLVQKENRILAKYPWECSDYVCSLLGPRKRKEILPKKYFDNTIKLKFENLMLNAPAMYHEELAHYYGDYMMPPTSKEEKELHHRIKIIK